MVVAISSKMVVQTISDSSKMPETWNMMKMGDLWCPQKLTLEELYAKLI
jgi:hypothetical protein